MILFGRSSWKLKKVVFDYGALYSGIWIPKFEKSCYLHIIHWREGMMLTKAVSNHSRRYMIPKPLSCNQITMWNILLVEKQTVPRLVKKIPHFMEFQGLFPHLQRPATYLYTEPDNPVYAYASHFWNFHFNIILSYTPRSSKLSLFIRFRHKSLVKP
jgi:hypothetical protein